MNLINLTLLAAAVSGAYVGWLWVPLWLDDLDVREAMAVAVSQIGEGQSDAQVRARAVGRLGKVGFHFEEHDGAQLEVPGLGVQADDVQIEREGRKTRVSLEYSRTVKLKPLDRYWMVPFNTAAEAILH